MGLLAGVMTTAFCGVVGEGVWGAWGFGIVRDERKGGQGEAAGPGPPSLLSLPEEVQRSAEIGHRALLALVRDKVRLRPAKIQTAVCWCWCWRGREV